MFIDARPCSCANLFLSENKGVNKIEKKGKSANIFPEKKKGLKRICIFWKNAQSELQQEEKNDRLLRNNNFSKDTEMGKQQTTNN